MWPPYFLTFWWEAGREHYLTVVWWGAHGWRKQAGRSSSGFIHVGLVNAFTLFMSIMEENT